ncbi:MAG: hypothetical protein FWG09_06225 [Synergistaceae bacterium]|nr:hypothetical protein [Synergistaceae bacterium]
MYVDFLKEGGKMNGIMKFVMAAALAVCVAVSACEAAVPNGSDDELLNHANSVLRCLKDRDYEQLASLVHKDKGVVFSPYAFVEEGAVKLTAARLKALKPSDEFTWGAFDGSGEPMDMSVEDYFSRFVYNHDFIQAPQRGVDELIKTGNTDSNIQEVFPRARFVEYHFPGFNPEFEGIDWASLRLVFEVIDGQWALVGVVHDCWTI